MDRVLREQFEFIECLFVFEGAVGIETQFHLMEGEAIPDAFHEIQFLFEVDGTDLQFHTTETFLQFLFHPLEHLVIASHPHESVDGDAFFTTTKGGVKEQVAIPEVQQRRLQAEAHRGVRAKGIDIDIAFLTEVLTEAIEFRFIRLIGQSIATQVGQWGTLAHTCPFTISEMNQPDLPGSINPARCPRRLLEMQYFLRQSIFQRHNNLFKT